MKILSCVFILLFLPGIVHADNNFDLAKERFFQSGKISCLKNMTTFNTVERKQYCDCTDNIHRANITDAQLKDLFSRRISLRALIEPLKKKYVVCEP